MVIGSTKSATQSRKNSSASNTALNATMCPSQALDDQPQLHEGGAVHRDLKSRRARTSMRATPPLAIGRARSEAARHSTNFSGTLPPPLIIRNTMTFSATKAGITIGHGVRCRSASRNGSGSAWRPTLRPSRGTPCPPAAPSGACVHPGSSCRRVPAEDENHEQDHHESHQIRRVAA